MHRGPHLSRRTAAAAALVVILAAVGAGGVVLLRERPVEVTPAPSASDPECTRLTALLPSRVSSQARRPTSPRSPGVAAWGDPAMVWLCGVPQPAPSPDCIVVSGVDWVYTDLDDGVAFTTYGRDPAVQVLVPDAYAPEPLQLPAFSAVVATVAQGARRCS